MGATAIQPSCRRSGASHNFAALGDEKEAYAWTKQE